MKPKCPACNKEYPNISKNGFFTRKSDSKTIQKFICKACGKQFSLATFSPCYHQNKRRLNHSIKVSLCSSMSMRRIAFAHNISRSTVKRKLEFLALQAKLRQTHWLGKRSFNEVEFDDLETFEHTKSKPISLTMAVETGTRKIIGFKLSQIGAKGKRSQLAIKKYGKRANHSYSNRREFFCNLKKHINMGSVFKSDMHTQYPNLVRDYFPHSKHRIYKGAFPSDVGQGELKRLRFDPLFSINHTFAMLRANISRLVRQTWCTTKKMKYLEMHLMVYVDFHNEVLT